MKKRRLKRIILSVISVLLFVAIIMTLDCVLLLKRPDGITPMKCLYAQEENTVDLLFLGSSHVGMNVDSNLLWKDYGIPSYMLWGSIQPLWNTYHFLVEALKTQTPKVVVLEVYATTFQFEYSDDARQVTNIAGMKRNKNRLEAIRVSAPEERRSDLFWGLPLYHSRYDEITQEDFEYFPFSEDMKYYKGSTSTYETNDKINYRGAPTVTESEPLHEKEELYLRKIIELCQESGLPIVLLKTPSTTPTKEQRYYNTVAKIAEEYSVEFLNCNIIPDKLGLEPEDFAVDNSHLNMRGTRKITKFIADWLLERFDLPDRRGEEKYESWDISLELNQMKYIKQISGTDDYFDEIGLLKNKEIYFVYNEAEKISDKFLESISVFEGYELLIENGIARLDAESGEFVAAEGPVRDGARIKISRSGFVDFSDAGFGCIIYDPEQREVSDLAVWSEKGKYDLEHRM